MLNTVTATLDQSAVVQESLAARDEFGPITHSDLFSMAVVPVTAEERDELGRSLGRFVPDGDLL
jgi:hypothetical protein